MNQKLYWTDGCASDIEVYDPETRYRKILFSSADGLSAPAGIVVDPTTGYALDLCMHACTQSLQVIV